MKKLAVIILSFNKVHFTNLLMSDIRDENDKDIDIYVIDNGDKYVRQYNETIISPPENLGWVRGNNLGLRFTYSEKSYDGYVLLNDDIRISKGFFEGLREAYRSHERVGLVAPLYDDAWAHQRAAWDGEAASYTPAPLERSVPFVDGTAFLIPRECNDIAGLLDEMHFPNYGWGVEFTYCMLLRSCGFTNYVTERSFINHVRQGSVTDPDWEGKAGSELNSGMNILYGPDWENKLWEGFK